MDRKYILLLIFPSWFAHATNDDFYRCLLTPNKADRYVCALKHAEAGDAIYQNLLARMLENGDGVKSDREKAGFWLSKARKKHIEGQELLPMGRNLFRGNGIERDVPKGLQLLNKAAELGYGGALLELGEIYLQGDGIARNNELAIKYFSVFVATNQDSSFSGKTAYILGRNYETGDGLTKDESQAISWYETSAQNGYYQGQFALGKLLLKRKATPKDVEDGMYWMRSAAFFNNEDAMAYLDVVDKDWRNKEAQLKAQDRRTRVDLTKQDEKFLDAVGMVYIDDQWNGSGFLITECHVLTSHHVVFDHKRAKEDPMRFGKDVKFGVGPLVSGTTKKERMVSGKVVGFDKKIWVRESQDGSETKGYWLSALDWALVKIQKSNDGTYLGEKHKPLCFLNKENGTDYHTAEKINGVRAVGYPGDKYKETGKAELWQDADCRIVDTDTEVWYSSCQLTPGMSGGPVVTYEDNCWTAIGINTKVENSTGGFTKADDKNFRVANRIAPLDTINSHRIKKAIKNNPCD